MKNPYYPFYPIDYMAKTLHLSDDADLLYRRLLDQLWINGGKLPDDEVILARCCRYDVRKFRRSFKEVREMLSISSGEVSSDRLSKEITKLTEKTEKSRAAAEKRWVKNDEKRICHLDLDLDLNNTTIGQTGFDRFWELYPKKVKKKNSLAIWKRKKLGKKAEVILEDIKKTCRG